MTTGAAGLTPQSTTMNDTMLITVLIIVNPALSICIGRYPASREAFSSFS